MKMTKRVARAAALFAVLVAPSFSSAHVAWADGGRTGDCGSADRPTVFTDGMASDDDVAVTTTNTRCETPQTRSPGTEYELAPWTDGDCASVPLTHVSAASWCTSRESWAKGALEYVCGDGSAARAPDKIRTRPLEPPGQPWGPWRINTVPCLDDVSERGDELQEAVEREMARLKVEAAQALIAPVTEWFAVQTPLTVYTRAETQRFEVTLIGSAVQIEVVPESVPG